MIIYYTPFSAETPDDIIRYDLGKAENVKEDADGRLTFNLDGRFHLLTRGHWHEARKDALYVVRHHVSEMIDRYQTMLGKIEEEIREEA